MCMNRIFLREKTEDAIVCLIEKQKIGVVGMSRGAGATMIATSIAKALSCLEGRKVTFLEICDSPCEKRALLYDAIGCDKRFKTREFVRFYSEIRHGGNIRGKSNPDDRINWGLMTPEDVKDGTEATPLEIIRLINNISGDLIVCDISGCKNPEDYLADMDFVLFVIDPMPSAMLTGYRFMQEVKRLEYKGKRVIWLVNKHNSGINKREMQVFLKLKGHYKIPFIAADSFYGAEYNCRIPFDMADVRKEIKDPIEKIIRKELAL